MKISATDSPDAPGFLDSERPDLPAQDGFFQVLPVPLEASVSYGTGAARGPRAILDASQELEAFDGRSEPCRRGICTRPAVDCSGSVSDVLDRVERQTADILAAGQLPVLLGGEHTVTLGALRAFRAIGRPVGVLQFDAHADLRDRYRDNPLSHACVARRILDLPLPLFQVGVRSLARVEAELRRERRLPGMDAETLHRRGPQGCRLPPDFPEDLYVTFDVDALDCSLMPATGTPEPGGLDWPLAMTLLQQLLHGRRLAGFDVVELAPIPGLHAPDFTAARLVYTLMGWAPGTTDETRS